MRWLGTKHESVTSIWLQAPNALNLSDILLKITLTVRVVPVD